MFIFSVCYLSVNILFSGRYVSALILSDSNIVVDLHTFLLSVSVNTLLCSFYPNPVNDSLYFIRDPTFMGFTFLAYLNKFFEEEWCEDLLRCNLFTEQLSIQLFTLYMFLFIYFILEFPLLLLRLLQFVFNLLLLFSLI